MDAALAALGFKSTTDHGPIPRIVVELAFRICDLMMLGVTGLAAFFLRQADNPALPYDPYIGAIVLATLVAMPILHRFDVYREDFMFSRRIPFGSLFAAWTVTFCILLAAAFLIKVSDTYSRAWALSWFLAGGVGLSLGRLALRRWVQGMSLAGCFANRTVIVGAGEQGLRLLGSVDQLVEMIRRDQVDQVIVALPWTADRRLREVVGKLEKTPVPIRLAPDVAAFSYPGRRFTTVGRLPMMQLFERPISGWSFLAKNMEDRLLAGGLLIALAPLLALIALAIRLDSPGPVFFRQKRYGFNHNLFDCWKFRTMHHHMTDANAEVLTRRDDARVTRVGRFLRRTSLDELPQLINVVKGDMSLVGPRPHATSAKAAGRLYEEAVDAYAARHRVKPGITGWAQVNGWRGETDTLEKIQRRVEYDLFYIDNWSLALDLKILLRTAVVVIGDREAY